MHAPIHTAPGPLCNVCMSAPASMRSDPRATQRRHYQHCCSASPLPAAAEQFPPFLQYLYFPLLSSPLLLLLLLPTPCIAALKALTPCP